MCVASVWRSILRWLFAIKMWSKMLLYPPLFALCIEVIYSVNRDSFVLRLVAFSSNKCCRLMQFNFLALMFYRNYLWWWSNGLIRAHSPSFFVWQYFIEFWASFSCFTSLLYKCVITYYFCRRIWFGSLLFVLIAALFWLEDLYCWSRIGCYWFVFSLGCFQMCHSSMVVQRGAFW